MAWTYTLIPLFAMLVGVSLSIWRSPSQTTQSAFQHFAAGVVFAAAAGELLPDLKHQGQAIPVIVGGGAGVGVMLGIKALAERMRGTSSFAIVTAIDLLIDGLVLGIGFAAGARAGLLLTVALTLEVLFLGVSVAVELKDRGQAIARVLGITGTIGLLLPIGALTGTAAGDLPKPYLTALFAFALVALLYLVTEELLVQAHEQEETPVASAMFFVGFLLLLLLEEQMQ